MARQLLRRKAASAALIIIVLVYVAGALAPWVSPYDFRRQDLDHTLASPSLDHPLGTDSLGRDVLSRVIWGARTNAVVTLAATLTGSLLLGVLLGAVAGYLGRWADAVIMRLGDAFLAFPSLLLVIFLAATVKPRVVDWADRLAGIPGLGWLDTSAAPDYLTIFGALALFSWVPVARLVRVQFLSLREEPFVEAARACGASSWRAIVHHMLPNAAGPVVVLASFNMGAAAGSEVLLSWLGVGVQPPQPSWGLMIADGQALSTLETAPHVFLAPAVIVTLMILAFNLLGDALSDALNPRLR